MSKVSSAITHECKHEKWKLSQTLTRTSLLSPANPLLQEAQRAIVQGRKLPCPLAASIRVRGGHNTLAFPETVPSRCARPRYRGSAPDVIPWELKSGGAGGKLRRTQLQLMRSSAQFGGTRWVHWGKGKKKHVTFLFSCLKSLSFRVREGIVALTLFFGRRVAACQRQLLEGSFASHAGCGFRGSSSFP